MAPAGGSQMVYSQYLLNGLVRFVGNPNKLTWAVSSTQSQLALGIQGEVGNEVVKTVLGKVGTMGL